MLNWASRLVRTGGMLHTVIHKNKLWRQGGVLQCTLCTSAFRQQDKQDPLNHVKSNPYYDKYAQKLREKQKSSPEEFEARLRAVDEQDRKEREEARRKIAELDKKIVEEQSQVKPKKLENIMKLELLEEKTPEEITEIWTEHHKTKDVIFATIPSEEYNEIVRRTKEFPTFVYPLPRQMGYEFFLQQFSGNQIFFTPLIAYQAHQENAPTCLTLTHYTELAESKDIVLMVGEADQTQLSNHEAQLLALQVKLYYGLQSGIKFNLVRQLNNTPDTFKYRDLVMEFENYKKDYASVHNS